MTAVVRAPAVVGSGGRSLGSRLGSGRGVARRAIFRPFPATVRIQGAHRDGFSEVFGPGGGCWRAPRQGDVPSRASRGRLPCRGGLPSKAPRRFSLAFVSQWGVRWVAIKGTVSILRPFLVEVRSPRFTPGLIFRVFNPGAHLSSTHEQGDVPPRAFQWRVEGLRCVSITHT